MCNGNCLQVQGVSPSQLLAQFDLEQRNDEMMVMMRSPNAYISQFENSEYLDLIKGRNQLVGE